MKTGYDAFFKKAKENAIGAKPVTRTRVSANSDQVVKALRQNVKTKIETRKKKSHVPWKLAGFSLVGLLIALGGFEYHEKIDLYLQKIEISLFGRAVAADTAPQATPPALEKAKEGSETAAAPAANEMKRTFTDEEINHFMKLSSRKAELDAREEELNRLEAEIQVQKEELEKRLKSLEGTRREISSVLEDRVKVDKEKIETLVQMYSTMKPQQAAKILETMDENLAVEIVGRMKKKNAAEVMNLMKPEKAKVFSERYAGYKQD